MGGLGREGQSQLSLNFKSPFIPRVPLEPFVQASEPARPPARKWSWDYSQPSPEVLVGPWTMAVGAEPEAGLPPTAAPWPGASFLHRPWSPAINIWVKLQHPQRRRVKNKNPGGGLCCRNRTWD